VKKCALVLLILLSAALVAGCTQKPKEELIEYPWAVILVLKYELNDAEVPTNSIKELETELKKTLPVGVFHNDTDLQIQLEFKDYEAFMKFNGSEMAAVKHRHEKKLFYIERTLTFENPWEVVDSTKINAITTEISGRGLLIKSDAKHFFVLETGFRRSSVETAYKSENLITHWNYYFYGCGEEAPTEIVLYDKFANQPAWYMVAIGATAIFMLLMFFVYRAKSKQPPPRNFDSFLPKGEQ